ncbi:hypothetical protein GSI_07965 [Ganoderma sinense ZZ0214-1]|uniref:Uncharacterized protein n=1 Tax=Ganoderma sinense ZZ0214-1 TaxID=1077348 RepID=A0A2G8S7K8_9APHY|nr:hypothetical protein GSI_07965 [Ganoderma sinense ZZ0214-1]
MTNGGAAYTHACRTHTHSPPAVRERDEDTSLDASEVLGSLVSSQEGWGPHSEHVGASPRVPEREREGKGLPVPKPKPTATLMS